MKLSIILEALEFTSETTEFYLDVSNNKTVFIDDLINTQEEKDNFYQMLEEGDFVSLPSQYEINEYKMMENFISTVKDDFIKVKLKQAISGKGAFRYFQDLVFTMGIREDWFKFKNDAYKKCAIKFCINNGLEYDDDVK
ncbi:hypothetical protein EZV73_03255 [Acidaminobacter sp. JC074]|uniref:UPF0158 family protein n=1 Tax=Acidaminobacter sp. JC074 TaxID=2530199 RepID=UPI001F0D75F4|nr:UPF0158 family protein [Acidaminobacter sp. JC074]MCH4886567.1 hypothetical protein [Acidaminobacter sp. JC074]